jgi:trehalose 6-phosphate synthase/phosphatase
MKQDPSEYRGMTERLQDFPDSLFLAVVDSLLATGVHMANIINVANRLPVTVGQEITRSSGGLVAALEGVSHDGGELKWIGWPGKAIDDPSERQRIEHTLEQEYGFSPIFLSDDEIASFYDGFSNSSLWPLLHYLPSKFKFEPAWWDAYQSVNRKFADRILDVARHDDLVWVHDYQLMLVPAMLREKMPSLRIGYFLHTPFPSYEVFRCQPRREQLVAGLLGADLIGFHTFGYMRHFRSAVLRLLGIESEMTRIRHDGQVTTIGVYPIGIHAKKFKEQLHKQEHAEQVAKLQQEYGGKQLVLSVERMDYTKGIRHRLEAIEMYLEQLDDREPIKFLFIDVPSRENVNEYQELLEGVEQRVGQINGKYATLHNSPIHFIHQSVSFDELCALYSMADVALVTPLVDGMNLVAKEYVAAQDANDPGVLVLSEFAGAAEELFQALVVNPYDAQSIANAISRGLSMSAEERIARVRIMDDRVMRFDAQWWARTFIGDLSAIKPSIDDSTFIDEAQQTLSSALAHGKHVGLFLDYDGTLRELERDPDRATPSTELQQLLKQLCDLEKVDVTLISGRRCDDLDRMFPHCSFSLIAEHGASMKRAGQQEWKQLDRAVSYAWKDEIRKVLSQFEASTPGSFIEDKSTSLVWHFRLADPEFGEWKARQLLDELAVLAANEPVVIRHGRKIVEIAANQISKGAAIKNIVEREKYDLVLCAGDDQTDESMYRLDLPNLITIKIGGGDTLAKISLPNPARFRRFLTEALAGSTKKHSEPAAASH